MFVARLVPEKGAHFLIDAYERLNQPYKLIIAGGSSHSDEYVAELQKHASDKVIFTGYVYGDELRELYSNAYCYVHPSTMEGLPVTLLEAVAYGNCVIGSDIPANMEVVSDSGLIFQNENVAALADALERVIKDPALAEELRAKALARGVKEYNYDTVTEKTVQVYEETLFSQDHYASIEPTDGLHAGTERA